MSEENADVFNPGVDAVSRTFRRSPSEEIRLMSSEGVGISFPANALETESGEAPYGTLTITLTRHLFPTSRPWNMPGGFLAINAAGLPGALTSFGTVEFVMTDGSGTPLDLKEGISAEITIPAIDGGPATIPLWYFDEDQQVWYEDGIATKIEQNYVGTVNLFAKWNADIFSARACVKGIISDADGLPVPEAIVTAEALNIDGINGGQVHSDAQGNYQIDGLTAGYTYKIDAFGDNTSDSLEIDIPVADGACIALDQLVVQKNIFD